MTTCLGKSCSFGLLCVSFMRVCQFVSSFFFTFGLYGVMWDLVVLVLDHCLSFYCSYSMTLA